jgi:hypothetical protein
MNQNIGSNTDVCYFWYVPPKESGRHMADPTKHFPSNDPAKGYVSDQEKEKKWQQETNQENNHPANEKKAPTTLCVRHNVFSSEKKRFHPPPKGLH